ncbi:MAG TPA: hypothetical protein VG867_11800 [Rhizomicrobium sp.]|nr:hypothetical protein [Rhizomicrobium sp.]
MVAYRRIDEVNVPTNRKVALSHELFHGLTPDEFSDEAEEMEKALAIRPAARKRLEAQLTERLMTPPDPPSWGPDWVKRRRRSKSRLQEEQELEEKEGRPGLFSRVWNRDEEIEEDDGPRAENVSRQDAIIAHNMEKSRQIAHFKWLYVGAIVLTLAIAALAMFVDYQIIRGDVWTRALSNEFMIVPASLQSTVIFKSLQVIFAVLIIHFMLKITGVYGRNAMVVAAFVLALVMIGGLGYLVAYNNMLGGTSATLEHQQTNDGSNSIDRLFQTSAPSGAQFNPPVNPVHNAAATSEYSLGLPKLSQTSLADADGWFWFAFATGIFFIVAVVAALYMQGAENNVRNLMLARDYKHRQRQFAQLHLLQLADQQDARA